MFRVVSCCGNLSGANGVSGMNLVISDIVNKRAMVDLIQNMSNWRRPFAWFSPCIVKKDSR